MDDDFFLNRNSSCFPAECVCSPTILAICLVPTFFVNAFTSHLYCGKL